VIQDRPLEPLQSLARLETKFLAQLLSGQPVRLERRGLTAGTVERKHQLTAKTLPQRMSGDQRVDFVDNVGMASEGKFGIEAVFDRRKSKFGEPVALDVSPGGYKLWKRFAAPECERFAELCCRALGVAGGKRGATFAKKTLKAQEIELLALHAEEIARALRDEHPVLASAVARFQQLAQP
jgi:hypothetical protein